MGWKAASLVLALSCSSGCTEALDALERGLGDGDASAGNRPAHLPPPPAVTGPRISEQDIATEPPFVGEEGLDPHGYPWKRPDKIKLVNLLRLRRFDDLDAFMRFYQEEYDKDFRKEYWPDQALSAFYLADAALEPLFDEWIKRKPDSHVAYAARGNYRYALAFHFRGDKYAHETTRTQFRSMDKYLEVADQDLRKAVEMDPTYVPAYTRVLQIRNVAGAPPAEVRKWLDAALERCPACARPREAFMHGLLPRWGGSYQAMDAFAAEAQARVGDNSRLALLLGEADADRCDRLIAADKLKEARRACETALRAGDEPSALATMAWLLEKEEKYEESLALLDRALKMAPHTLNVHRRRYWTFKGLDRIEDAAKEIIIARQIAPLDEWVSKSTVWMVDKLRFEGQELNKAGKREEAGRLFELALQLAPDDKDLMNRQGWNQKQSGTDDAELQAQLDAAPDDFELRLRIDHGWATQRRFDQVVEMWDAFITRHPTDPRPWRERGGAKWHLRQHDAAIADMKKACTLGMQEACNDAKGMQGRLGR